ncbi:MAG TPA: hypothetical protein VN457_01715, partial [Chlamydiales bacterium]|nr:hypothetical protein [Chlamydiales bacterium]
MHELLTDIVIGSNQVTANVCGDIAEIPFTLDDPLAAVGRIIAEVFGRVFAAGAGVVSLSCTLVYIIPAVVVLTVEVISQRGFFSFEGAWATLKVNLLFLKLLILGNLAL